MYCIVCGDKLPNDDRNLACEKCFDENKEKFLKAKISYGASPITGFSGVSGFYGFSEFSGVSAVFCPQCGILFPTQDLLDAHLSTNHIAVDPKDDDNMIADKLFVVIKDNGVELNIRKNPYLRKWRMVTPKEDEPLVGGEIE
jgi:hypothetical protein